ncbi:hypothetical protein J6590_029087 [Homalodisca vitripennis]|nr:hypothetical protein J6590_029087 [Homalodisca vitripennis]
MTARPVRGCKAFKEARAAVARMGQRLNPLQSGKAIHCPAGKEISPGLYPVDAVLAYEEDSAPEKEIRWRKPRNLPTGLSQNH